MASSTPTESIRLPKTASPRRLRQLERAHDTRREPGAPVRAKLQRLCYAALLRYPLLGELCG